MSTFWYWFGHLRTTAARADAATAKQRADEARGDLRVLEERLAALSLVTQAMWELMRAQGYSEQALEAKVEELDLRDGARDGRLNTRPVQCGGCGHRLHPNRRTCFWCGEAVPGGGLFP